MDRNEIAELIIEALARREAAIHAQWTHPKGTRTRHFVVDDLLPVALARRIYDAYPSNGSGFIQQKSFREQKRTSANLASFAPILTEISLAFQSPKVVGKVADLTRMRTLEPDPLFYAGGLSMMLKGDFLNPHIDNSHDSRRNRYRRLNLLYYVSPDWTLENGGNFELWDEGVEQPKTIISTFNRLLVMETNSTSYHSVSPVQVDAPRCCVSNYFFSKESPTGEEYFHVTSFSGRPEQKALRALGYVDNLVRSVAARVLGGGRGRDLTNKAGDHHAEKK